MILTYRGTTKDNRMANATGIIYRHVDCLSFAWELLSGPWFEQLWLKGTMCNRAARRGHLECLKYLHEVGCRWDSKTCVQAAKGGNLGCLIMLSLYH
ncbi:balbiani ring protein 3-like [Aphis craccivora]|uniref:Balbiani ring protein 3-like n=1 Tax=Aphis craccivora TaxID=307492 RepID=A0A6G0WCE8_APHCR|nr:balbiani ring protein 3-like [Aphis craccivora]